MPTDQVVLIARAGQGTWILYNALRGGYRVHLLLETPPSRLKLIRARMRRLGLRRVVGQLLFQSLVRMPLAYFSRGRRHAILREHGASATPPLNQVERITSVNSPECWARVKELAPKVIVINGTRILSKATLKSFGVPVLNTHVGITPKYRGVHGAYWALANNDPEHCGVTVHLVDSGIDTGGVLHQALIVPTNKDNLTTYPTLQLAVGSQLLNRAVAEVLEGKHRIQPTPSGNRRWYHPTLWEYFGNLIRSGTR